MAAKIVRVSEDDGVTWANIPGDTSSIEMDSSQETDTVFGQEFNSSQPTLISWSMSGNARYKGFAGYKSTVKSNGVSTAFTGEALSLVSGQKYKTDDVTKEIWNWNVAPTIYDDAVEVAAADIAEIDYLFGTVTFADTYTVTGAVTADGEYYPTSAFGKANTFSLTQTADTTDTTDFETAQANGGFNTMRATLLTVSLELGSFYRADNNFFTTLKERGELLIDIVPEGVATGSVARGIFKMVSDSQDGDVGGDENESVSFELAVPEGVVPFGWFHPTTSTIPEALKIMQNAWRNRTEVKVQYLPEGDGNPGKEGNVIITDASLESGVESLVEASLSMQGTGAVTEINVV